VSLVVVISGEQTKETDENVGYLFLSGLQNFVGGNGVKQTSVRRSQSGNGLWECEINK
jgi:hypothetical protein